MVRLLVRWFVGSLVRSFVRSFVCSFVSSVGSLVGGCLFRVSSITLGLVQLDTVRRIVVQRKAGSISRARRASREGAVVVVGCSRASGIRAFRAFECRPRRRVRKADNVNPPIQHTPPTPDSVHSFIQGEHPNNMNGTETELR